MLENRIMNNLLNIIKKQIFPIGLILILEIIVSIHRLRFLTPSSLLADLILRPSLAVDGGAPRPTHRPQLGGLHVACQVQLLVIVKLCVSCVVPRGGFRGFARVALRDA